MNTTFCGDQFDSDTRTYDVIVPATGHAPTASTSTASVTKVGPTVQTDRVSSTGGSETLGMVALGGAAATAGAFGVTRVARRRH